MGLLRDTWKGFWSARAARYQAQALREQAEVRRQQRRLTLAAKDYKTPSELIEQSLLESSEAIWGGYDRIGIFKDGLERMSDFARGGVGLGAGGLTDHRQKRGGDFPFFNSESEYAVHRDLSRLVVGTNDNAKGLLGGLRRYTLGTGATVRACARVEGQDAELVRATQAEIDSFIHRNKFAFRQREFFTRTSRDGEGVFRLFANDDGTANLRFVWPEQIKQPQGLMAEGGYPDGNSEEWSYGRLVEPDDAEVTVAWALYRATGPGQLEAEIVPAEEIIYFGPNADSGVKRSLPDFCLSTGDALEAAGKLATNMGEGSAQQAAISYIRQHEGVPRTTVSAFRMSDASYTKPDPYTGQDIAVKKAMPGTIIDTNENTKFLPSPYNAGIDAHLSVFQMLVRRAESRWNAPEWLATSYSQEVNFASSLTAESPFVKAVEESQEYYTASFVELFERVLAIAAAANRLPRDVLSKIEVKVTFPSPRARDHLQEAQRAEIRLRNGTTSPQRVAEADGDEWDQVVRERRAAKEQGWTAPGESAQPPGGGAAPDQLPTMESLYEAEGFTGTTTDSLGREYHWVDGKRVTSEAEVETAKEKGVGDDSPADADGGDQSASKQHSVVLPRNPRKLTTGQIWKALQEMGYGVKLAPYDLKTKTARFELTHPDGSTSIASSDEVAEIIYQGAAGGDRRAKKASPPEPADAEANTPAARIKAGVELYTKLRDTKGLSISDVRAQFARLESLSKAEVEGLLRELGYTPMGSKAAMLQRLRSNLEGIKLGQQRVATIIGDDPEPTSSAEGGETASTSQNSGDGGDQPAGSLGKVKGDTPAERIQSAIGIVSTYGRDRAEMDTDYDMADAIAEQVKGLSQEEMYKVLTAAGLDGLRPNDSKGAMVQRLRNRLTASIRAAERAEA